jgi:hypothetical protein
VAGASLGRSLLQARQRFISTQDMTDPTNVKTLAQFVLLGDPFTTPCLRPHDLLPPGEALENRDVTAGAAQSTPRGAQELGRYYPQGKGGAGATWRSWQKHPR